MNLAPASLRRWRTRRSPPAAPELMRPPLAHFRRGLRGPLLALVVVLIAVILAEFALIARLGLRVLEGQRLVARASAQQMIAFGMENNAREQDMALFRHMRTGEPIHLQRLADKWVEFSALVEQCRHHLDPGSEDAALLDEAVDLAAEADSLAGILIMLRQAKAADLAALQGRIERASRLLAEGRQLAGDTGALAVLDALNGDLKDVLLGVSAYVSVPEGNVREGFEGSLARLTDHSDQLAALLPDGVAPSWAAELHQVAGRITDLGRRIVATQTDEAEEFARYSAVLQTLAEDVLSSGLRASTTRRVEQASAHLAALAHRTVTSGLLLGGLAALLGLVGGLWLYTQAMSAHEYARMFGTLIDHAPLGVLLHDHRGVVTYANPASRSILGVGDEGRLVGARDVLGSGAAWAGAFGRALDGRSVVGEWTVDPATLPFPSTRSEPLHLQTTAFRLTAGAARKPLVVLVLWDITDRVRAEAAKAAAEREMEEQRSLTIRADRLRSLGQMAAGIAHELNQPLVGVRGLAEHLKLALDRGWEVRREMIHDKAELIVAQADRMEHIIEHVRMFAREAGRPVMSTVAVNEVVTSTLALVGAQLAHHGLEVDVDLTEGLPPTLANPFSLEEVLINLVLNARDAVEERISGESDLAGPHLIIATWQDPADEVRPLRIDVRDRGTGIPGRILETVFDPFFTTKGPQHGTGLGLSIARAIIEDFGGVIELHSREGEGTTVTIALPAAAAAAAVLAS